MACFRPLPGWYSKRVNPETGKRSIVFSVSDALVDRPISVPCGQCTGCRMERARQWAIRCCHEASLYDDNCFLTLTYNDENIPQDWSLDKVHLQKFFKRLRKSIGERRVRYFACGEYGERCRTCGKNRKSCRCACFIKALGRPHYHLILFNYNFADRVLWKKTKKGDPLFTSEHLSKVWPLGFCSIGGVSFESAAYVGSYVTKKKLGPTAWMYYCDYDDVTGEISNVKLPEFSLVSNKPDGLGAGWFKKFVGDLYPSDECVIRGRTMRVPRYYDQLLKEHSDVLELEVKRKRKSSAYLFRENNTSSRHRVRETVAIAKMDTFRRSYEEDD